jgi:hypothetical protein
MQQGVYVSKDPALGREPHFAAVEAEVQRGTEERTIGPVHWVPYLRSISSDSVPSIPHTHRR